jgi:hypothetical protein
MSAGDGLRFGLVIGLVVGLVLGAMIYEVALAVSS